jgi:hypothetical protein
LDAERREREAAGEDAFESVWSSSYVDSELLRQAGASSQLSLAAVAMRVAELIGDLKPAGKSRLIELLNEAFDAYRAADDDQVLSAAATSRLVAALEEIAAAHPKLTPKAADLQSQLAERRR